MTREQAIEQQIDEVMDEFDFHKVAEYMKTTNWQWYSASEGVPNVGEIRRRVRDTMRSIARDQVSSSYGGGFLVTLVENEKAGWMRFDVKFVMEGWDVEPTDYTPQ